MVYTCDGGGRGRRADLAHQGGPCGGGGLRADRRLVHGWSRWSPASLWGKPMWGTYWAWDPRLTSELLLLFLYLGYMGLRGAFDDLQRADRASAVLAIVGVVNVPIVHYSVVWWNSLHQGSIIEPRRARPRLPRRC